MANFDEFIKAHGAGDQCQTDTQEAAAAYSGKLPQVLINFWSEYGWCAYLDGLIWFTNPADYEPVVRELFPDSAQETFVFGRTAFGDLLLWRPDGVNYLFVHYRRLMQMADRIDLYVNVALTDNNYLDEVINRPYCQLAREKLGPLSRDEMYGFEPALALGGGGELDSVAKVRIYEHLSILAQVTGWR